MAVFQTNIAKGIDPHPQVYGAGIVHSVIATYSFVGAAFTAAADKVELFPLPANCRPIACVVVPAGTIGNTTIDIGVMSGEVGSTDNARTVGNQIINDGSVNADAVVTATLANCLTVTPTANNRSIGMTIAADVAAGARTITVRMDYIAG